MNSTQTAFMDTTFDNTIHAYLDHEDTNTQHQQTLADNEFIGTPLPDIKPQNTTRIYFTNPLIRRIFIGTKTNGRGYHRLVRN